MNRIKYGQIILYPVSYSEIIGMIESKLKEGAGVVINYINLHGLNLYFESSDIKELYDDPRVITYVDGMPIRNFIRLFSKMEAVRFTLVDHYKHLFSDLSNHNILWIGGTADTVISASKLAVRNIVFINGYETRDYYVDIISTKKPEVVILGMGMPYQESVAVALRKLFPNLIIWCVGATLDNIVGKVKTSPRWLSNLGFEWLYRLAQEPRRMAYRYLIEPFILLFRITTHKW
jgi:N-acetylglucosaminyldiphosphoundecaprenol N-acetyl-beta-D-mannosaminyltransferase